MQRLSARGIVKGEATGPALVSPRPVSFLGDIDIRTGTVVSTTSPIAGRTVGGFVLVVPASIGSAGAWRFLYQLHVHETNPVAIVSLALPDSSLVQGAILAGIPIVTDVDVPAVDTFVDGEYLTVDGTNGVVWRHGSVGSADSETAVPSHRQVGRRRG